MNTKNHGWRLFMPYCLKFLGKDCYVILNRYYRPLGHMQDFSLPEKEYQVLLKKHSIRVSSPKQLQKIHWGKERDDGDIFLHPGSLVDEKDWSVYLEKVRLLAKLTIEI